MPTAADGFAVDTSVAVAALDAAHAAHHECRSVVQQRRPALAGHAAFETFSVLTRMPGQLAVSAPDARNLMMRVFPRTVWPMHDDASALLDRLGAVGVTGGAVYDALVGWAAHRNSTVLLTRDHRARRTYDLLGVEHEFVGP